MIYASIILFAIAAIVGFTIFTKVIRNRRASRPVAYLHGLIALAAILLLVLAVTRSGEFMLSFGMIIFIMASVAGGALFFMDSRKKILPIGVIAAHATLALIAFIILLIAIL